MKCANLYVTTDSDIVRRYLGVYASVYVPVYVPGHGYIYVRAEIVEVNDLIETIDHANAKARDGETFLNGIPLPVLQ